jgi:F-type H+-transporting ATPase subunit a
MSRTTILRFLSIFTFLVGLAFTAGATKEKKFNVSETIMHHIGDAHEWHLWGEGHQGTSIYLPVILYDNGIKVFSSKHLYHGKAISVEDSLKPSEYLVGEGPAEGYALLHEKIYKLNNGKLDVHGAHPKNAMPLDLSITKNVLSLFIGAFILLAVMLSTSLYYKKNGAVAPRGIAKFIEPLIVYVRDEIVKPNIHGAKHTRYIGFITTIFFFILVNNLLGMIPIFPGGANLTGNISVTLFLALCTLLVTVFSGNKNYWKHIFATPGVPWALLPIMIPIELVGIFTKPFALMIRLFANMTAGHIIVLSLISIIFINKSEAWGLLSVPMALFISVLEILVAFLQAYLFASLSALFIGAAVEEDHH